MENNDLKGQKKLKKEESIFGQDQVPISLNKQIFVKNLTNEQKLEYLRDLIQDVEQKLESTCISKKLVKKDDNLKR
jgi:hypothetical protein